MPNNRLTFIYGLMDPRDMKIRYIGQALRPYYRLKSHITDKLDKHNKKREWLEKLQSLNINPYLVIFEKVPLITAHITETKYLQKFKRQLYNSWFVVNKPVTAKTYFHNVLPQNERKYYGQK